LLSADLLELQDSQSLVKLLIRAKDNFWTPLLLFIIRNKNEDEAGTPRRRKSWI
jgi:hypothetical protein